MKDIKKIADQDRVINLAEENQILQSKKINQDDINAFDEWFDYGAASTIGFLIRRLKLIKQMLDENNQVTIEDNPILVLSTHEDLKNWIRLKFDEALIEKVYSN
jgi:hypothetical protein